MPRKEVPLSALIDELLDVATPTLEELADAMGMTPDAFLLWRQGKRKPRRANLENLARLLRDRHARAEELAEQAIAAREADPERRVRRKRPPASP